jgi:protein SCO1/2
LVSFIILVFGIYAVPKILNRIQQGEVVKGDRLDKVNAVSSGVRKLEIIGPAPSLNW